MRAIFAILLWVSAAAAAADPWLQQVEPIITHDEKRLYASLEDDSARESFRAEFWARRTITQSEYLQRMALADAQYGSVKQGSGARTDRGRVLIALGRPHRVQQFVSSKIFVPTEVWDYDTAPGAGVQSAMRLLFYRANDVGDYRLYSPTVDTFRSLLNPRSNNKGMFPIDDLITKNDILERMQPSPAEMEIVDAAIGVARGITGIGNDEALARASSPREALLRHGPVERVESKLLRYAMAPQVSLYWGASEGSFVPARLAIELSVKDAVRMTLRSKGELIDDTTVNLNFDESRSIQLHREYPLVAGESYELWLMVDGRTYKHPIEATGPSALGDLMIGDVATVAAEGLRPFLFGAAELTPNKAGRFAALQLDQPNEVQWRLLRNGRTVNMWTTPASEVRSGGLATTRLPEGATLEQDGVFSIEAQVEGAYRGAAWEPRGSGPKPTVVSYNVDLTPGEQANIKGLQQLIFGDEKQARELFERAAAEVSPASPRAKVQLGRMMARDGELGPARAMLVEALQQQPLNPAALAALGYVEHEAGNVRLCAQYYRRAVALHPSAELRSALAEAERQAQLAQ